MDPETPQPHPGLASTRCSYCGELGHTARHHPDYEEWNARTLERQRANRRQVLLEQQVAREMLELRKLLRPRRVSRPPIEKECEECGEVFEHPASVSRKYCSRECYYQARRDEEWEKKVVLERKGPQPRTKRSAESELEHVPGSGFALARSLRGRRPLWTRRRGVGAPDRHGDRPAVRAPAPIGLVDGVHTAHAGLGRRPARARPRAQGVPDQGEEESNGEEDPLPAPDPSPIPWSRAIMIAIDYPLASW